MCVCVCVRERERERQRHLSAEDLQIMAEVEPCVVWKRLRGFREPEQVNKLVAVSLCIQELVEDGKVG